MVEKTIYTAPQSGSVFVSTITAVSFDPSVTTSFKVYVNGIVLFNSLSINPLESHTLVLDNLGITLDPGSTISVYSGPGPNVFVSLFGATSYGETVSIVQSGPGLVYDAPADKDFICNGIAISNNSSTPASVQVSVVDDAYTTENVFAFVPLGPYKLYKTDNFNSWVAYDLPAATYSPSSISYIDGTYVFFSTPTKKVYTSTDLISWTNVYTITQSSSAQGVMNVSYGNGILAITLYGGNSLQVLYSSNLVNWTFSDYGYSIYRGLFMYESTSLNAFIRIDGNYVMKSTDLITWTNTGIYVPGELSVLQYRSPILNKYYGFYDGGSYSKYSLYIFDFLAIDEYDNMPFNTIDLPPVSEFNNFTRIFKSIAYGNNTGVIIAKSAVNDSNGQFQSALATGYVSTDMENWTAVTMPAVSYKSDIVFSNGLFVFSYYNSTSWFVSTDGITWEMKSNGPNGHQDTRGSSLSYSETVSAIPTSSDIVANLSIGPAESVLIKSGYTLSSNSGIVVSSDNSNIGVGIFGAEI